MKEPLTYVVGSFLKEGGQKMALTFQEHWIYSGSTSVPNALLQNYRKLQLTADECLLIAWLMQRHPEESFVIDVRGQDYKLEILRDIKNKIIEKSGYNAEILFKRE